MFEVESCMHAPVLEWTVTIFLHMMDFTTNNSYSNYKSIAFICVFIYLGFFKKFSIPMSTQRPVIIRLVNNAV
jgi:hypothetical protein